jgi:hypothetical protein
MKESLDKDFARFIEKNGEVLKMLASESSAKLDTLWRVLVYIFEFNYLSVYETNDGTTYRKSYECDRSPLKELPEHEDLIGLMQSAYARDKAESTQKEEIVKGNLLLVEAIAAIPLVIDNEKKILIICKQLEKSKDEVIHGYVFDGYKLQLYLSVIRNFVRVHEQQKQLRQSHEQLMQSHKQINQSKNQIRLAAIAAGVFALLEGLSSTIGIIKESSLVNVTQGLLIMLVLVFLIAGGVRMWPAAKPFKIFVMIDEFLK